jgi:hypothetical protein
MLVIEVTNMANNSKLLIKIQRLLREIGCPRFLHHFGPKKYELKHHITALIVMQSLKLSLRRAVKWLKLFLLKVPTYSALCRSRKRIPATLWNSIVNYCGLKPAAYSG